MTQGQVNEVEPADASPRFGIVFLVVLLDIVSFSLLLPVLPYYAATFGATPTQIGFLTGLYALCQFFGAPIIGRLSDKVGRKPMFLVDIGGNFIGFLVLASASSLWMLFLARFIAGCVAANIPVAQAYISDVTTKDQRSSALGLIGAAFGVGFTIGPALGGILSKNGYVVPALLSAGLCAVNFIVIALFLPESLRMAKKGAANEHPSQEAQSVKPEPLFDIALLRRLLTSSHTAPLLILWAGFSFAFAMFQQNIALFNKYHLNLTARETGYVFAWIGILVSLMQGVFLRILTRTWSDETLLKISAPLMVLSLVAWAFTPNVVVLLIILVPLSFAASTLITVINSLLTKASAHDEIGGAMGIAGAIDNSTRFGTAFVGGLLIQRVGTFAPGAAAAVIMFAMLLWRSLGSTKSKEAQPRDEGTH